MSYFLSNIKALQQRYPGTPWAEVFTPLCSTLPPEMQQVQSRSGLPTLLSQGQAVHSQYNPKAEAEKIALGLDQTVDAYVLIGLGLGYLAQAVHQTYPQKTLILIEPELALFAALLSTFDISALILNSNVHFFFALKPNVLLTQLSPMPLYHVQIIPNRTLALRQPDYYESVQKEVHLLVLRKNVNFKTLQSQGKLWIRNLCHNMLHLAQTPGVQHLYKTCCGYPAFIIAAGPSTDDLWPYIHMVQQRCLIVCVDTALRICLQHNIVPDFVIVIDSQYWNSRHLDNCLQTKTIFIADPSLYPPLLRYIKAPLFLTSSLFPLGQYIEKRVDIKGELISGGSVTTNAFDFCRKLEVSSIWTIGLDLAFPNGQTHAQGARFEEWALYDNTRLFPAETFFAKQSYSTFPLYYPAQQGGHVLTDKRMEVYRLWFEEQAPTIPCFNLSRGIRIEHMATGTWEQLRTLPVCRPQLDAILQKLSHITIDPAPLQQQLYAVLQEIQSELTSVHRLCLEAMVESKHILTALKNQQNIKKYLDKLNYIDRSLSQSQSSGFLSFLLEPFFRQFYADQDPQAQQNDPLALFVKNSHLYTELATSTQFYKQLLNIPLHALRPALQ